MTRIPARLDQYVNHEVWLTPAAGVPCSNAANTGERKTWTQRAPKMYIQGTSPGDGQTSCKVWLTSTERCQCSKEAKTQNPLKFAGLLQTPELISAVSGTTFTILWGHVGEILVFNKFFRSSIHASVAKTQADTVVQLCPDGNILRAVFPPSRMQNISDMHSKFALRPHHVWKYGRYPICDGWDKAREKRRRNNGTNAVLGNAGLANVHCVPKNIHLFIFRITLSKINRFERFLVC